MIKATGIMLAALWCSAAAAQEGGLAALPAEKPAAVEGVIGAVPHGAAGTEYVPLTRSERLRLYITGSIGPAAILRAAASAGVAQASGTPKEWKGGAEAFGERFGNSFAEHIIRKTLESGGALALHEDNRYFRYGEGGVWRRSMHAVTAVFLARNEAGDYHFAYSRFGGTLGAAFLSRIWQPPSKNTSGDAAINFGLTMATNMAWNAIKEFRPQKDRSPQRR